MLHAHVSTRVTMRKKATKNKLVYLPSHLPWNKKGGFKLAGNWNPETDLLLLLTQTWLLGSGQDRLEEESASTSVTPETRDQRSTQKTQMKGEHWKVAHEAKTNKQRFFRQFLETVICRMRGCLAIAWAMKKVFYKYTMEKLSVRYINIIERKTTITSQWGFAMIYKSSKKCNNINGSLLNDLNI